MSNKISLSVSSGTLQNALQQISNNTGLRFAYRESLLKGKNVTAGTFNTTIDKVLQKLLSQNHLCYTWQNKQIIIHANCFPTRYTISGTIFEDSSFIPIPYVSVSIAGKNTGAIADRNGHFEIVTGYPQNGSDIIIVSSMGYNRDSIEVKYPDSEALTIVMKPKVYAVPPVVVHVREYVEEKLGNTRDREAGSLYLDTHGQQAALFISNKRKRPGLISSVSFYLSDEGNTDAPVRIRIYKADSSGMPGIDIIEDAIVVKPGTESGWYSLNLEKLQLEMPAKGVFVAVEGVYPDDYDQYYGDSEFIDLRKPQRHNNKSSLAYGQRIGYNRKCRKETWHYSMSKVWFQLNKQAFGVMISAVVKYEKEKIDTTDAKSENDE